MPDFFIPNFSPPSPGLRFSESVFEAMRRELEETLRRAGPFTFMEVCGTHTVSIFRSGLRSLLPQGLSLLSGPGCPVCVTGRSEIDRALELAEKGCLVLTYGDMMRVPGTSGSLMERRGQGASVEVVTSAMQAVSVARENPDKEAVFLGVGFETTAPATAAMLKQARLHEIRNLSVLCLHKAVPPVMRALCSVPGLKIDGFLLPGNVTVVSGESGYAFLAEAGKAAAVAGFEPEEIMAALVDLARQAASGVHRIHAFRTRDVPREGNAAALRLLAEVFEPCDALWRGLGLIPDSGLRLGKDYSRFDALERFDLKLGGGPAETEDDGCQCGKILSGLMTPPECGLYGTACTPLTPVGPCMVSSEGTCGTWYRFNRQ
ncbi:MAG: hydrogenase formation protein HypD [Synergistaceae bacterium]|jgi:hydrogenase expression/formation protein HypD|nr:hydrogenase formation protein HypD [Synergistaceae bacterium]